VLTNTKRTNVVANAFNLPVPHSATTNPSRSTYHDKLSEQWADTMGVVYTGRVATNIPRLKPLAGAKCVIVCCVTRTSVSQSLSDLQTHLCGVKLRKGTSYRECKNWRPIRNEVTNSVTN
jgi:hypothetical protein